VTKLTKTDLVKKVSAKSGLSKKDSAKAVSETLSAIKGALAKGEKVQLIGFGTFDVFERAARTGMNPQTKKKIMIPDKKSIRFRAGKPLKDAVA
jgi:DNA-binding protein HU-beta